MKRIELLRRENRLLVGIAESATAEPPIVLVTAGLGSCVAVALYDTRTKRGALGHVMMPNSAKGTGEDRAKYADTAVPDLFEALTNAGSRRSDITARIAGGAHMFKFADGRTATTIGARNVSAVISALERLEIPIVGQDTGGNYGRTVSLELQSGLVSVSSLSHGTKNL